MAEEAAHAAEGGHGGFDPLGVFELRPIFPAYSTVEAVDPGAGTGTLANGAVVPLSADQIEYFTAGEEVSVNLYAAGLQDIHWYTITNATLWMAIAVLAIFALFVVGTQRRSIVPGRVQSIAELIYGFTHKMVEDVAGEEGVKFFPYILTLFLFILFVNYLGLLPLSFAPTSHIAVTAVMALVVFIAVTVIGFVKNGAAFLGLFWMKDSPLFLRPIIAVIEVISYFVRPVSHSIRLAGNVMAGHAVMQVFAGFAGAIGAAVIAPLSIVAIAAIYGLEMLVAGIQAYVFTILTCVYLKDALHPGH